MTNFAQRITSAKWFGRCIIAVILFAGLLSGLETNSALVERYGSLMHALDRVVLAVFIAETALKIASHGPRPFNYFRDGWNVFDFAIVVLCLMPGGGSFGTVLRLVRILRLLRLVTAMPKLQLLVGALLRSLSAMGYVGILLAMLFYMYAVAGVHMFSRADEDFGSFGAALITLFRVVTLDDWGNIYDRAAEHASAAKVAIYFVSFILLGTMIVMNLFIGIILSSLSETHAEIEKRDSLKTPQRLDDELIAVEEQLEQIREELIRLRTEHKSRC